ncbi:hypothetical protein [Nocardioides sp.]|uniref:hypothetical protein n=1 Tax=Nocardioides sp. TaxID=35761 RepID=UPI0032195A76
MIDGQPIEFIYYDEPDFITVCPKCRKEYGIPIHSMRFSPDWLADQGMPEGPEGMDSVGGGCPHCGHSLETPPRVETAPDGTTLYTTDRRTLLDAGLEEGESRFMGLTLSKDGVEFQLAMSGGSEQVLVVCDDCGLPFTTRIAHQAVISSADTPIDLDMNAGPCEHCGGSGSVLTHIIDDGILRTVTPSPGFAENVLSTLADDLREGKISVGAASTELRKQGGPYRVLADWIDARPVNSLIASTLVSAVVGFAVNQIPPIAGDSEPSLQQPYQRPEPGTYTEDQVVEIVERMLDHYDRKHGFKDSPEKPRPKPDSE